MSQERRTVTGKQKNWMESCRWPLLHRHQPGISQVSTNVATYSANTHTPKVWCRCLPRAQTPLRTWLNSADHQHPIILYNTNIRHLDTGFVQNYDCGFPDFSRTKLLPFPDFSRHFVHLYVNINITKLAFKHWNFLYNVFFYSKYRMGLKFLNSELQMLCVMNCKKINKCISNQLCNRHPYFPNQHYSFQGFLQTFPYLWSFSEDLSMPCKFVH